VRIAPNHVSIADTAALQAIYGHASGTLKAPFYDVFANFRTRNIFNTRERAEHARKRRIESHMFAPQSAREPESTSPVHPAELTPQWDGLCGYTARKTIEGAAGKVGSCEWQARRGRIWFNCVPWCYVLRRRPRTRRHAFRPSMVTWTSALTLRGRE